MADLSKLVNELSNLTVIEAAELAAMLGEKWGVAETGQPGGVRAPRKPTEGADIKLMHELVFQPSNVVLQRLRGGAARGPLPLD
jgi:ribosomal protein L7/L12